MRSTLKLLACFAAIILVTSCSDDEGTYVCNSCVDSPEALTANNSLGKGIYKGVILGSSGTIKLNIANNDNSISGVLTIDNKTIQLLPYMNDGVYNQGYSGYLAGKYFVDNDVIIEFTVNSTGTEYSAISLTIPTHTDVVISIIKEFSTGLVEVFEGTFSGDANGTFNLVMVRDTGGDGFWLATSRDSEDYIGYYDGEIDNHNMTGGNLNIDVEGNVDGDNVNGSWSDPVEDSAGTWKGRRTL